MAKYVNYVWYSIAGVLLLFVAIVVLVIFAPRPWYQFRKPAYREAMMNVAKQIGFSSDEAILEGGGSEECEIIFPRCTCYQFMVFPTNQNFTEFQQQMEVSNLKPISTWGNYAESHLFDYLLKSYEPVLQVDEKLGTWEYFKSRGEGFTGFYSSYDDQKQRRHSIEFFSIGEVQESLQLLDKPFSGNLVVVNTEMGSYPSWACESRAQVTNKP